MFIFQHLNGRQIIIQSNEDIQNVVNKTSHQVNFKKQNIKVKRTK